MKKKIADNSVIFTIMPDLNHTDCPYCGAAAFALQQLSCDNCRVIAAQEDYAQDCLRRQNQEALSEETGRGEFLTETARKHMRAGVWSEALAALSQGALPREHIIEFIVFRDVCRAAELLTCRKDKLAERYFRLDVLAHNLKCLDYYLPQNEEQRFRIFSALYEALTLLAGLPVRNHTHYAVLTPRRIDYTCRKLVDMFRWYAKRLEAEAFQKEELQLQCLKTALRLNYLCLEMAQEKHGHIISSRETFLLHISPAVRQGIKSEIARILAVVSAQDIVCDKGELLPDPKILNVLLELFLFSIALFAAIIGTALVFSGLDRGSLPPGLSNSSGIMVGLGAAGALSPLLLMLLLKLVYGNR